MNSIGWAARRAAPAVGLAALAACAASSASPSGPTSPSPSATVSVSSSISPSASPKPSGTPKPQLREIPSSWVRISSAHAGVSFAFPPPGSSITYRAGRASTGASYGWTYVRAGVQVAFAGSATADLAADTRLRPTDASGWTYRSGTWRVVYPRSFAPVVNPIRIVSRPDGLTGIVFDAREFWGSDDPPQHDRIAVLNFPADQPGEFEAIAFYFLDETWIEDIDLVLRSVTFSAPWAELPSPSPDDSPSPEPTVVWTLPARWPSR